MEKNLVLSKRIGGVLLAVQAVMLAVILFGYVKGHTAPTGNDAIVAMDALSIAIAMLFYLSILRSDSKKQDSVLFLLLLAVNSLYLFLDGTWHFVQGNSSLRILHILINVFYLICPIIITLIYWQFLDIWVGRVEKIYQWANPAMELIACIHISFSLLSPLTGWFFIVSQNGSYRRGSLYILTIVLPFIMIMMCIVRILRHKMPGAERIILLSYLFPPMVAAIIQGLFPGTTILSVATFLFVALLYTNYYVRKEAEIAGLQHDLTKSDLKSLQMQINPHFLYNTLHSAAGLCDTDGQAAQEMIYRLAQYMRDNFTDIEKPSMVTFREELTQLDHYLDIESIRFPNITITKDVEAEDFLIPVSTMQPIVENSIKHGIGKRKKSAGTIRIASSETADAWLVRVSDDGVGFDEKDLRESENGHFGLDNVRKRLKILCNGTLGINSIPGEGTTVQISIPKNSGGGYNPNSFLA